jgi:hypothetical protein
MGMVTAITLFWSNKPNPAILFCSYHVTALYCAWCEMPRGVSYLSAKPKSSSYFDWLFIPNILLEINDGPGLAALYHRSN